MATVSGVVTSLRILHVGGEDVHMRVPILQELRDAGFEVAAAGSQNDPSFARSQIPFFHYDLERSSNPIADMRSIRQLRRIRDEWCPDVVHAFDTKPGYLVPLAIRNTPKTRVVRTVTGMGTIFSKDGMRERLLLRPIYCGLQLLARARGPFTVFQNTTDQAYFERRRLVSNGGHRLIFGSGVPFDELRERAQLSSRSEVRSSLGITNELVFTMVSRMVRTKGAGDLIDAIQRVDPGKVQPLVLLVGPTGGDEPDAVPLDELQRPGERVRYLGRRDDVAQILAASDVFVLPTSYREGIPRALLEAMAIGLPSIVSDGPGCGDVIQPGRTGWIVPRGSVAELQLAIESCCATSIGDRREMGDLAARECRDKYSLTVVAGQTVDLYRDLVAS